jgi:hypothetical protein
MLVRIWRKGTLGVVDGNINYISIMSKNMKFLQKIKSRATI